VSEPAVALTDYGLAIECAILVYLLHRSGLAATPLGVWLLLFFGSIGVASLAGGTVHGFVQGPETPGWKVLWGVVLVAIGATALSGWAIGAGILFPAPTARWITIAAAAGFVGYSAQVLFVAREFRAALIFYLPAALFLFGALCVTYVRRRERRILVALLGLGLTFIAAAVQQGQIAPHPRFNHNALYHLIQALALWLLFLGLRSIATRGVASRRPRALGRKRRSRAGPQARDGL
jgi:hypothetical protein